MNIKKLKAINKGEKSIITQLPDVFLDATNYMHVQNGKCIIYDSCAIQSFINNAIGQAEKMIKITRGTCIEEGIKSYHEFMVFCSNSLVNGFFNYAGQIIERGMKVISVIEEREVLLFNRLNIQHIESFIVEDNCNIICEAITNIMICIVFFAFHSTSTCELYNQIRVKLSAREKTLRKSLDDYIYSNHDGLLKDVNVNLWSTLYGWILLKKRDTEMAINLIKNDDKFTGKNEWNDVYHKVMKVFDLGYYKNNSLEAIIRREFGNSDFFEARCCSAMNVCNHLEKLKKVRQYAHVIKKVDNCFYGS